MRGYFDRLAPVYDDWWTGTGRLAPHGHLRPGWHDEVDQLLAVLHRLEPARTLDVACGTGFLTRHLPGEVVGLDQSKRMLGIARRQAPNATFVLGDALSLPFASGEFERVIASHLYAHLGRDDAEGFLAECRRVALELVLIDTARKEADEAEELQLRQLPDGTRWNVIKRRFTPEQLTAELGGGEVLHAGRYFVVVRSRSR